jgi:hypothetical protein
MINVSEHSKKSNDAIQLYIKKQIGHEELLQKLAKYNDDYLKKMHDI